MPYLPTAQEWLTQSALLLQARPTTTRISTKYTLNPPSTKAKSKSSKTTKAEPTAASTTSTTVTSPDAPVPAPAPAAPTPITRAILTLKTYDPASGVTLKYQTDKQAEVGRLISSLARLGRSMAGLPELKDDVTMTDVQTLEGGEAVSGVATPVPAGGAAPVGATGAQTGGQGGKKGKKKGRK